MVTPAQRLSFLYFALFFEIGVSLPFFPLWLRAQSLDDGAIGFLVAAPLIARIVANPLVTAFADSRGRLAVTLVACSVIVAAGTGILTTATGFVPILALVVAIALAQGPLIALTDTLTLAAMKAPGGQTIDYGRVRLWGSLAFAAASLCTGSLLLWLPPTSIILILAATTVLPVVATLAAARLDVPAPHRAVPCTDARLDHAWRIGLVIAGAACVQASHAAVYTFSTLHWQAAGLSSGLSGALWALGILSEICLFALVGRSFRRRLGPAVLTLLGGTAAVLRWAGMALDPGPAVLAVLQLGHGLTFGATHLGSIVILSRLAPPGLQAQAQGWLAAAWAGLMAALTMLCGQLYAAWGEYIYLAMAAVAATGTLLLWAAVARQSVLDLPVGREATAN